MQQSVNSVTQINLTCKLSFPVAMQIAASMLLGVVMLFGVGFAKMDAVHNAAHDSRHSFAFPCH